MAGSPYRRTDELKARHKRVLRGGILVSLLLHLLVLFSFRTEGVPRSPFAAAGPRAGDDRAAPAGGGLQALNLRTVQPREAVSVRPPEPIPAPEVTIEIEERPAEPAAPPLDFGKLERVGATPGKEQGPTGGIEGGEGRGDGGSEAEGRFRVVPPAPRGLILPPADRPRRVRGKEVTVWVFVTEKGAVVPDSTRLLPSTGDSNFDERLKRQAAEWIFEPAKKSGKPVAEWFRYMITL